MTPLSSTTVMISLSVRSMATDKAGGADLKKRMDLGRAQAAERAERQKESQSKVYLHTTTLPPITLYHIHHHRCPLYLV
jgi:hypothetical protein